MAITDLPTKWPTRKVVAGAGGAGAGAIFSDFIDWSISVMFLDGKPLAAPPERLIEFLTPVVLAFVLAYFTPRGAEEVAPPSYRGEHVRVE